MIAQPQLLQLEQIDLMLSFNGSGATEEHRENDTTDDKQCGSRECCNL
jgi:hypothetical protein